MVLQLDLCNNKGYTNEDSSIYFNDSINKILEYDNDTQILPIASPPQSIASLSNPLPTLSSDISTKSINPTSQEVHLSSNKFTSKLFNQIITSGENSPQHSQVVPSNSISTPNITNQFFSKTPSPNSSGQRSSTIFQPISSISNSPQTTIKNVQVVPFTNIQSQPTTPPSSNNNSITTQTININQPFQDIQEQTLNYCKIYQLSNHICSFVKHSYQNPSLPVKNEDLDSLNTITCYLQQELSSFKSNILKRKSPYMDQSYTQNYSNLEGFGSDNLIYQQPINQIPNGGYVSNYPQYLNQWSQLNGSTSNTPPHPPTKIRKQKNHNTTYINLTETMIKAQTKKAKKQQINRVCVNCKATETPEWRRGPAGAKTLCNACGIRYRLNQNTTATPTPKIQISNPVPLNTILDNNTINHPLPPVISLNNNIEELSTSSLENSPR